MNGKWVAEACLKTLSEAKTGNGAVFFSRLSHDGKYRRLTLLLVTPKERKDRLLTSCGDDNSSTVTFSPLKTVQMEYAALG